MLETQIQNFLLSCAQVIMLLWGAKFTFRLMTGRIGKSKRRGDSEYNISKRLFSLMMNPIIYFLDDLIYNQKEKRKAALAERQSSRDTSNIFPMENARRAK